MFKAKVKHVSTTRQKTQTKLTFAALEHLDELELLQLEKAPGYLVFSPDDLKKEVEEAIKDLKVGVDASGKSPSKRLRGALYEYWYKHQQGKKDWQEYYREKMEGIIKMVEDRI